jgi:aspartate aminotransferase-like enzyme
MTAKRPNILLTPGPTPIPPAALAALAQQVVPHRSADFLAELRGCREGLQGMLGVTEPPVILTCSGTGAMEAAAVNLLAPHDAALVVNAGRFGGRWGRVCEVAGAAVSELRLLPGTSASPGQLRAAMPGAAPRAMFLQGVESSTGALMDVAALATELKRLAPDCLVVVDGVTWFGAHDCQPEAIGVDALVLSSQKALGAPPGLAMLWLSERAWKRAEENTRPRFYFDLPAERAAQNARKGTRFTPAVNTVRALAACIAEVESRGGIGVMIANARACAGIVREAAERLGLALFADHPSDSVTALVMPDGVNGRDVKARLESEHGILVADGQDNLCGKLISVGHMGFVTEANTRAFVAALEAVLTELK